MTKVINNYPVSALIFSTLLQSCSEIQQIDTCDGVVGACSDLYISYHNGSAVNYTLEVVAIYDKFASKRISSKPETVVLPGHLRLLPPPGIVATDVAAISIRAINGGELLATAKVDTPFLDSSSHRMLTADLIKYTGEMFDKQSVSYQTCKGPRSTRIADIDGDGHNDIIATCYNESKTAVLYGSELGQFIRLQPDIDRIGKSAYFSAVMDVDKNGTLDIVTPSYDDGTMGESGLSIAKSNNNRTWIGPSLLLSSESLMLDALAADITGDGIPELLVTTNNSATASKLLIFPSDALRDSNKTPVKLDLLPVTGAYSLAAGLLDEDKSYDIIVAGYSSNSIAVVWGSGMLSSLTYNTIPAGNGPMTPIVADIDNDRKPDIIVSHCGSPSPSVIIYKNIGNRQFVEANKLDTGKGSCSAVAEDFDRDGMMDLAVRNDDDFTISILRGIGNGEFRLTQELTNNDIAYSGHISAGDLNNDGMPDLVVSGSASNYPYAVGATVSIHYNKTP